jgi:hypothetical protein
MPHHIRRYTGIFAHPGLQRAREQAHAAAARRAAKLLEAEGRGGDRHLIHVTDEELVAIRNSLGPDGKAGHRNPITGLESFAPEDDASTDSGIIDGFGDRYATGRPLQSAAFNVLRSMLPPNPSSPYGSTASFTEPDQPLSGGDAGQADPYQLAQGFVPLFVRPPWLLPRPMRPLEEYREAHPAERERADAFLKRVNRSPELHAPTAQTRRRKSRDLNKFRTIMSCHAAGAVTIAKRIRRPLVVLAITRRERAPPKSGTRAWAN